MRNNSFRRGEASFERRRQPLAGREAAVGQKQVESRIEYIHLKEDDELNISRLDLIFQKEPREIQEKLMKLLISYNASLHYVPLPPPRTRAPTSSKSTSSCPSSTTRKRRTSSGSSSKYAPARSARPARTGPPSLQLKTTRNPAATPTATASPRPRRSASSPSTTTSSSPASSRRSCSQKRKTGSARPSSSSRGTRKMKEAA